MIRDVCCHNQPDMTWLRVHYSYISSARNSFTLFTFRDLSDWEICLINICKSQHVKGKGSRCSRDRWIPMRVPQINCGMRVTKSVKQAALHCAAPLWKISTTLKSILQSATLNKTKFWRVQLGKPLDFGLCFGPPPSTWDRVKCGC